MSGHPQTQTPKNGLPLCCAPMLMAAIPTQAYASHDEHKYLPLNGSKPVKRPDLSAVSSKP